MIERVERERLGLLYRLPLPQPLRVALGILLLDYTLWWWHYANHRSALLWRFHLVHHVDRDLDVSTAARFHFGEMSLSVFFRMAQVRLLGIPSAASSMWQALLLVSIFFDHSNLRLPRTVERHLVRWIVTPRMHGIHHSDYRDETNSNWSSLFSWWDRLHGTLRLKVPQQAIRIGVPAYQQPPHVTLGKITALPFVPQRSDWMTDDGVKLVFVEQSLIALEQRPVCSAIGANVTPSRSACSRKACRAICMRKTARGARALRARAGS